jgi:hypothetical protein
MGALALAGVAAVGTAVYFTEKKASASPALPVGPSPSGQTTANLISGHRYTATFVCPSSISTPTISGITGVSLVSTTQSANGGVVVFDYTGASGSYPIAGAGCTVAVIDNGVSPTPAQNLPTTGDVFSALTSAQQSTVLAALVPYEGANDVDLTQASNRAVAVANFQQQYDAANPNVAQLSQGGVLDAATYNALIGA